MSILRFENINKSYGNNPVITDLSFNVRQGEIFGLLGPNGAGKTTLMRLITNITLPNSGNIFFKDKLLKKENVRKIGYMPEERGLYNNMKILEHLLYIAKLYNLNLLEAKKNIEYWLTKLDMITFADKYIGSLSKGMSQKIQFIATVIHSPELLVLDEPFSGLDPISSQVIENELNSLKENGTSIILSTHRMDQVENFCDEVLLINKGQKIIQGSIMDLKNTFKDNLISVSTETAIHQDILSGLKVVANYGTHYYFQYDTAEERKSILRTIIESNSNLTSFNETLPRVNDIFIKLINDEKKYTKVI